MKNREEDQIRPGLKITHNTYQMLADMQDKVDDRADEFQTRQI